MALRHRAQRVALQPREPRRAAPQTRQKAVRDRRVQPGRSVAIFVQEPGADRYIEVPSNDPAYTTGLALWTHKVICRYAKLDVNRRLNVIALMRAKDDIRRIMSTGLSTCVTARASGLRATNPSTAGPCSPHRRKHSARPVLRHPHVLSSLPAGAVRLDTTAAAKKRA